MRTKHAIAVLSIALGATVGLTACGDDDDDGAAGGAATSTASGEGTTAGVDKSKPPVRIAVIAPKLAGSTLLDSYETGTKAAAETINAAGGIGGREVVLSSCNSQAQPATTTTCARRTIADKPVAMVGCETSWGAAGRPVYAPAGVPSITCLTTSEDFTDKMTFGLAAGGPGQVRASARWLCEKAEVKKVGLFVMDIPSLRQDITKATAEPLEGCGKELVSVAVPPTASDLTPYVSRLMREQPDWVVAFWLAGPPTLQLFKGLEVADFPADQVSAVSSMLNKTTSLEPVGAAIEGVYGTLDTVGPGATEDPDVQQYLEAVGEDAAGDPAVMQGYMFVSWIAKAGEEIGADKLDGPALAEYMNTATDVEIPLSRQFINPGPGAVPQQKQPFVKIVQWRDGALQTVEEGTEQGWINGF